MYGVYGQEEAFEAIRAEECGRALIAEYDQRDACALTVANPGLCHVALDDPLVGRFEFFPVEGLDTEPVEQVGGDPRIGRAAIHQRCDALPPLSLRVSDLDGYRKGPHVMDSAGPGRMGGNPPGEASSLPDQVPSSLRSSLRILADRSYQA